MRPRQFRGRHFSASNAVALTSRLRAGRPNEKTAPRRKPLLQERKCHSDLTLIRYAQIRHDQGKQKADEFMKTIVLPVRVSNPYLTLRRQRQLQAQSHRRHAENTTCSILTKVRELQREK